MENKKLKEVLNQVTVNYNTLQSHLVTIMQEKERSGSIPDDRKTIHDGGGGGDQHAMVPLMDLGLSAPTAIETDENSQSSSEHDENSRSPPIHNNKMITQGDESSEQGSQGVKVGSNKVPRLNASKTNTSTTSIDQATEATIRKARVSVRARSEAPMVLFYSLQIK